MDAVHAPVDAAESDIWASGDVASLGDFAALRGSAMQSVFKAFEKASEGTLIVDRDARIVWISEKHARRFGFDDPRSVRGWRVEDVIPNSRMREVVSTGQAILLDILDAPHKPVVVIRMPLKKEDGEVVGAVGFALFDEWTHLAPLVSRFLGMQEALAAARKERPLARQAKYNFSSFVGVSPVTIELKRTARRAAATHSPVLLLGETGTGKELLAHAIHGASPRAHRPFVSLNMAAIPDTLIEAELFGVAPGAYTGADRRDRQGKLQIAQGGTLFLDEIGDMPLPVQSKLLRVLQEKEFEPLGSNEVIRSDVRIVAATSRKLLELVKNGQFRADLYYRLDVLSLAVPPLRERIEDLELICEALLESFAESRPGEAYELHREALAVLARQRWPGNIRELRNVLERTIVLADTPVLTAFGVQAALQSSLASSSSFQRYAHVDAAHEVHHRSERSDPPAPGFTAEAHAQAMSLFERQLIERALAESPTVASAAKRLGMGRATLYRKMAMHRVGRFRGSDASTDESAA